MTDAERAMPLVTLADDGELRASTEIIAVGMEYGHESVIKLVRNYEDRLSEFGPIRFEIRVGTRGGKPTEYALLNEQQSGLLISLMRNKPRVVNFKVDLVREFFRMREALRQRDETLWHQRLAVETRDASSLARASWAGRELVTRKMLLPGIEKERAELKEKMEPGLFAVPKAAA